MRIKCLNHVHFEGPAKIQKWAEEQNHQFEIFKANENQFPDLNKTDALVIMGGPMSVNDENEHPWLIREKSIIKQSIESGKKVLGVCLGAQLIANALGTRVYKNEHKEIGWFPVQFNAKAISFGLVNYMSEHTVFHWHGETFDLPKNAVLLASSPGCTNQVFSIDRNVLALQFHLELAKDSIKELITNCAGDITNGIYIQTPELMLSQYELYNLNNREILESILNNFFTE